ncbi:hypothetical protein DL771_000659 [Monosporascus sp. 5C6A]|nr:hypothetical protein DL771_000659 [Monosporascus sp. 5C6A]
MIARSGAPTNATAALGPCILYSDLNMVTRNVLALVKIPSSSTLEAPRLRLTLKPAVKLRGSDKAASLLARLEGYSHGRAHPVRVRATPGCAIRVAEAPSRDELRPVPLPNILTTSSVGGARTTGGRGIIDGGVRCDALVPESAALFPSLELRADARADAGPVQRRATCARAVRRAQTGAPDELPAGTVADVLVSGRIGPELGTGQGQYGERNWITTFKVEDNKACDEMLHHSQATRETSAAPAAPMPHDPHA